MDKKQELARTLRQGYESWRHDKIELGYAPSQLSEAKFCREYKIPPTSWTGWVNGVRVPTDLDNINKLAACPYIGNKVYRILGLVPVTDDNINAIFWSLAAVPVIWAWRLVGKLFGR